MFLNPAKHMSNCGNIDGRQLHFKTEWWMQFSFQILVFLLNVRHSRSLRYLGSWMCIFLVKRFRENF